MSEIWYDWDSGPSTAVLNMAWDEVLLESVGTLGAPVLRTYSWNEPAATFGYFQHYDEVAAWTELRPLIRRTTGGGLVRHDADWTYCIAVPPGHWWYELKAADSYRHVHKWLKFAFARIGVETLLAPDCDPAGPGQCFIGAEKSDLLHNGRKIAGAAQRRNKFGLLIQGSIQPLPAACDRSAWEKALRETGAGRHGSEWHQFSSRSWQQRAEELAITRYSTDCYNRKR